MASPPGQLAEQMLRYAFVFQGVVALPLAVVLGAMTFDELWGTYLNLYDFFLDGLDAIFAAGIIFAVLVQLKVPLSDYVTLVFESVKSGLATILWLSLIVDAQFGPWQYRWNRPEGEKAGRTARALACSILLLVFFYPTLIYSHLVWKSSKNQTAAHDEENTAAERDRVETERTPLLS